MINLIKKYGLAILIVTSTMGIFFVFLYKNIYPIKKPKTQIGWNGVVPGKSTEQDVLKTLGQPKNKDGNILNYGSKSETRDNKITIVNGTAVLIKEMIAFSENRSVEEITVKHGDAKNVLYGKESVNGNYLFVYPDQGIAYIGNPTTKTLVEIWYFEPVSNIIEFAKLWGEGYSTSQKSGQF